MAAKTYRYRLAGPSAEDFRRQCGISPTVVAKGEWTIDLLYEESRKDDVDSFLLDRGYEFVQELVG